MRTLLFTSKFQKDLVTQMCHEVWKPIQTSLQLALRLSQIRYKGRLTRSNFSHTSIEASMDATTGLTTDHFQNRFCTPPSSRYPRCDRSIYIWGSNLIPTRLLAHSSTAMLGTQPLKSIGITPRCWHLGQDTSIQVSHVVSWLLAICILNRLPSIHLILQFC